MTLISVANNPIAVAATVAGDGAQVVIEVIGQPIIQASTIGIQGAVGPAVIAGPGFKLVGSELRHDIATLTRA